MGYPMTYIRVIGRSQLWGGDFSDQPDALDWREHQWRYGGQHPDQGPAKPTLFTTQGDLRRLEHDQRDEWHLAEYARRAGITPEQARAVLDAFFTGNF